jgi:hypothetical protein
MLMFKSIFFAVAGLAPAMASAATVAEFEVSVDIYLQTTPGEELVFNGGGLPAPTRRSTSGDATVITGDDGGGTTCCGSDQPIVGTDPVMLGTVSFSASGAVNSIGSVDAEGQRLALLNIGNFGASTESVSLLFDIDLTAQQSVDPLVGGAGASGGGLVIQRDGVDIFDEEVLSSAFDGTNGESLSTRFNYDFDLLPIDDFFTEFRFSLTGGVIVSSDADEVAAALSAVPLPASGLFLLAGCIGMLGLRRRAS